MSLFPQYKGFSVQPQVLVHLSLQCFNILILQSAYKICKEITHFLLLYLYPGTIGKFCIWLELCMCRQTNRFIWSKYIKCVLTALWGRFLLMVIIVLEVSIHLLYSMQFVEHLLTSLTQKDHTAQQFCITLLSNVKNNFLTWLQSSRPVKGLIIVLNSGTVMCSLDSSSTLIGELVTWALSEESISWFTSCSMNFFVTVYKIYLSTIEKWFIYTKLHLVLRSI